MEIQSSSVSNGDGDESLKSFSSLQYITKFPHVMESRMKHRVHNIGRAAGFIEKLDERVTAYLKGLITKGHVKVKDLKSRAEEFVQEKILLGEIEPSVSSISRKRFYPTSRKVRNLITSVRLKNRYSKLDQENLKIVAEKWSQLSDIHFIPRYYIKE